MERSGVKRLGVKRSWAKMICPMVNMLWGEPTWWTKRRWVNRPWGREGSVLKRYGVKCLEAKRSWITEALGSNALG